MLPIDDDEPLWRGGLDEEDDEEEVDLEDGGKLKRELEMPGVSRISPGSSGTSAALSAMSCAAAEALPGSLTSERLAGEMIGASSVSIGIPPNGLFSMSNIEPTFDAEDDWDCGGGGCCGCCDLRGCGGSGGCCCC